MGDPTQQTEPQPADQTEGGEAETQTQTDGDAGGEGGDGGDEGGEAE